MKLLPDGETWYVEKHDKCDMKFLRAHPEIAMVFGSCWDLETEQERISTIVNPYGKYGYINRKK